MDRDPRRGAGDLQDQLPADRPRELPDVTHRDQEGARAADQVGLVVEAELRLFVEDREAVDGDAPFDRPVALAARDGLYTVFVRVSDPAGNAATSSASALPP